MENTDFHISSPSAYILSGRNSREFKEGEFQRGQTQRGGAARLCGSPFDPVPEARPAQNQRFIRTNQYKCFANYNFTLRQRDAAPVFA